MNSIFHRVFPRIAAAREHGPRRPVYKSPAPRSVVAVAASLLLGAWLMAPAQAQQEEQTEKEEKKEGGGILRTLEGSLDSLQASLSKTVLQSANTIDGFFADERYLTWENNTSNVRARVNFDGIQDHGTDVGGELKIHLLLPGTGGKWRFVANDDDDADGSSGGEDFSDESSVALRYMGIQTDKWGLSVDLGVRIKDSKLAGYPRLNVVRNYNMGEKWAGRSEGRFYYYTDTGVRVDLRQYFEHKISKDWFFRSRTRAQYFEEEGSDIFPEQRFTLFQRLGYHSALAYEALAEIIPDDDNVFDDDELLVEPQDKWNQVQVRLRYRRNVWRPWFFFEVWPIVAWTEQRDYETTLAARLRLEFLFGHVSQSQTRLSE